MERFTLRQRAKTDVHILHISEHIFRRIFELLNDKDVYFTLRNVCRKFKVYTDQYVQLKGIFLLLHDTSTTTFGCSNSYEDIQTKLIYVFTRNQKVSSMSWSPFEPIPRCPGWPLHRHPSPLGGVVNGKLLVCSPCSFYGRIHRRISNKDIFLL